VFAVWEPILESDTAPPPPGTLRRLDDPRVEQFWDPAHGTAALLQALGRRPRCCVYENAFLWDLIAAFPPGSRWDSAPPSPALFDGTIVRTAPELEALVTRN